MQLVASRLTAQLLGGAPARTPEHTVERLLAVQAQDPRGARLAVRARTRELTAADVDAALTERRSLVVSWLNRGTLHLVRAEDYWWLHTLTAPQQTTAVARRLAQLGLSPAQVERGVAVVTEQVSTYGPRTRPELGAALDSVGVPTAGQALVHLLFAASVRGRVVRGPMRGAEQCFVGVEEWLGPPPEPLEPPDALARLARRYLAGHGPADARDLAKWAGITLRQARAGLGAVGGETVAVADGLVDLRERGPAAPLPPPRLLGAFDPVLHGWTSRDLIVGPHEGVVTTNGLFRPFALVGGHAVATWGLDRGQVTVRPLERLRPVDLRALERDAADVLRFLGLPAKSLVVRW